MMLIGAVISVISFSACTDQDDVDISYDAVAGVSAANIFKCNGYEPYETNDFDPSIDGWKLNLQVLIYDNNGTLVDQAEKSCSSISETLDHTANLKPGTYTVISIADFREGLGGFGYKFWNISNTANLNDLTITENENIYPVAFETLGLDIQNITVKDKLCPINANIKPITALVHIYENNNDCMGAGIDGYSRFTPVCAGYFIRSNKFKNTVKIENGSFSTKYEEQTSEYNLAISEVTNDWLDKKKPLQHSYRALLPDKDCIFKWHIQKNDLKDDDVFSKFAGKIKTDGVSNQTIDIVQGKQYVLNMILDCLSLDAFEYPEKFKANEYAQKQVDEFNKKSINEFLSYNFESILERDENWANTFLGSTPESHNWSPSGTLYLANYPRPGIERYELERTVCYLNEKVDCAVMVQFLLPNLSDDILQYIREKLTEKYRVDQEYTSPNNYCFLNPDESVDSHYRIVLQKEECEYKDGFKTFYFLNYILRNAYQPKDDDTEDDIESLIFPYEWESFMGKNPETVISKIGSNYDFDTDTWTYSNYNKLISVLSFSKFYSEKINSVMIFVKPSEKVNESIKKHLKTKFIETSPGHYADSEDFLSRTITISYDDSNGMLLYSAY